LRDEDTDGEAIIKWFFKTQGVKEGSGFVWLRTEFTPGWVRWGTFVFCSCGITTRTAVEWL